MKQTRAMSLIEAAANVAVGYGIAVLATMIVLPAFGYRVSGADAFGISAVFTLVSMARSYALRRLFEAIRVAT